MSGIEMTQHAVGDCISRMRSAVAGKAVEAHDGIAVNTVADCVSKVRSVVAGEVDKTHDSIAGSVVKTRKGVAGGVLKVLNTFFGCADKVCGAVRRGAGKSQSVYVADVGRKAKSVVKNIVERRAWR